MTMTTRRNVAGVICVLGMLAGEAHSQTDLDVGFYGLGFADGFGASSAAMAITPDGLHVAGWCDSEAMRWSPKGPMSLGRLDKPYNGLAVGAALSADGRVVVGYASEISARPPYRAFVWREGKGMTPVGGAPAVGSFFGSYASGVSADGSVIVGASDAMVGYPRAFAQMPGGKWAAIMDDPSTASAVSGDGRVVVGVANLEGVDWPFAWTAAEGTVVLGDLSGGFSGGIAYAVNFDGSVIVGGSRSGESWPEDEYEAFRWTAAGGMMPLGDLPTGDYSSEARAVSADGSIVVGLSSVHPSPRTAAFIWDATRGMRDLREVLINEYHLDLDGWELSTAQGISADGRTVVGRGRNPDGQPQAWIAHMVQNCPADWNADGAVTSVDFVDFVEAFLCSGNDQSCPSADFNMDGVTNSNDFFAFVVAFFNGCA